MSRSPRGAVALVPFALVLAACSATEPAPAGDVEPFASAYEATILNAASQAQVEALREASVSGSMTYETIASLVEDTLDCFASAGVNFRREDPMELAPGILLPMYGISDSDPAGEGSPQSRATACEEQFSTYALVAYQNQQSVGDALDAALLAELPQVLDCLASHGYTLPADSLPDEVRAAVNQVLVETDDLGAHVLCSRNL